jgi:tagatose 6-phosphate kinase
VDVVVILIVGQNSVWQKLCSLPRLERGEVNRVREVRAYAAGKGVNAARAAVSMGAETLVLGYAGGRCGRFFMDDLSREGIRGDWTRIGAETRICTTYAEEDGLSTELIEPTPRVSDGERARFLRTFMRRVNGAAFLIISGTTVEGESEDCYAAYIAEAHRLSVPVLLDSACAAARKALSESPEILKVNIRELALLLRGPVNGPVDRRAAYAELARTHGIRWIIATDGAEGMEGFDGSRILRAVPPRVRPVKTIGGGDAAAAGIALSMLEQAGDERRPPTGAALEQALIVATAMGTASCLAAVGGSIEKAAFQSIRNSVTVRELPPS